MSKATEVRGELLGRVQSLPAGSRLPAERKLGEQLRVARETLRRALDDLEAEGWIERRPGVGAFTSRPKASQRFRVRSFTEEMSALGMQTSSRLLRWSATAADARISERLRVSPGDPVFLMKRLRLADGLPMAIEVACLRGDLFPGFHPDRVGQGSLYAVLRHEYGQRIVGGSQSMEATVASPTEARLLAVPNHSPIFLVERVTWNSDREHLEFTRSLYRGDRYKFYVDLEPSSLPSPTPPST